jgi:hypothetical protein
MWVDFGGNYGTAQVSLIFVLLDSAGFSKTQLTLSSFCLSA